MQFSKSNKININLSAVVLYRLFVQFFTPVIYLKIRSLKYHPIQHRFIYAKPATFIHPVTFCKFLQYYNQFDIRFFRNFSSVKISMYADMTHNRASHLARFCTIFIHFSSPLKSHFTLLEPT